MSPPVAFETAEGRVRQTERGLDDEEKETVTLMQQHATYVLVVKSDC